ncbi:MAG: hypothetical protein WD739_07480 [Actinomycetota bacterium]
MPATTKGDGKVTKELPERKSPQGRAAMERDGLALIDDITGKAVKPEEIRAKFTGGDFFLGFSAESIPPLHARVEIEKVTGEVIGFAIDEKGEPPKPFLVAKVKVDSVKKFKVLPPPPRTGTLFDEDEKTVAKGAKASAAKAANNSGGRPRRRRAPGARGK